MPGGTTPFMVDDGGLSLHYGAAAHFEHNTSTICNKDLVNTVNFLVESIIFVVWCVLTCNVILTVRGGVFYSS